MPSWASEGQQKGKSGDGGKGEEAGGRGSRSEGRANWEGEGAPRVARLVL